MAAGYAFESGSKMDIAFHLMAPHLGVQIQQALAGDAELQAPQPYPAMQSDVILDSADCADAADGISS